MVAITLATTVPLESRLLRSALSLDKLVHLVLYFGLGWTVGRALWRSGVASVRAVLFGLLAALCFAALDEWHQRFLATRNPSLADWLADTAGVCFGLALSLWRRPRRAAEPALDM